MTSKCCGSVSLSVVKETSLSAGMITRTWNSVPMEYIIMQNRKLYRTVKSLYYTLTMLKPEFLNLKPILQH